MKTGARSQARESIFYLDCALVGDTPDPRSAGHAAFAARYACQY